MMTRETLLNIRGTFGLSNPKNFIMEEEKLMGNEQEKKLVGNEQKVSIWNI